MIQRGYEILSPLDSRDAGSRRQAAQRSSLALARACCSGSRPSGAEAEAVQTPMPEPETGHTPKGLPLLGEKQLAAMRYYVGQTDKIDGEFDPMTCTIKRPEGYEGGESALDAEKEPETDAELKASALRKAEKNRKKREQKKRAKLAAQGKDPDKVLGAQVAANGWSKSEMPVPRGPSNVRPEKPPTHEQMLRDMGFGRREREKLQTFERLTRLTGILDEMEGPDGEQPREQKRASVNDVLQELVQTGGSVDHITDARHNCARLTDIASDLVREVDYIMKYPDEARGRDVADLLPLRNELQALLSELASRAGEPELMKTEAAERMRQKLERKLLPKLQASIPKWAEQLRFMHADVLKWSRPEASRVLLEQEKAEREREQREKELEAQKQAELEKREREKERERERVIPEPDDEELRVLQAMGWSADDIGEDTYSSVDPVPEAEDEAPETADPVPETESESVSKTEAADPVPEPEAVEPGSGSAGKYDEQSAGPAVPADPRICAEEKDAGDKTDADGAVEPFQVDPTDEFIASPGLDFITKQLNTDDPECLAASLFVLAGAEGLRCPWGDAQLAGMIAANGGFHLLRMWGMGAPLPAGPDPNDTGSGNGKDTTDKFMSAIFEGYQYPVDDGSYTPKAEARDTAVIEGDGRQAPLTHEEVHTVMDRYAGVPQIPLGGGEPVDLLRAPKSPYRSEQAHEQALAVAVAVGQARKCATDLQLLTCFRHAMKLKLKEARQAEQKVIREEGPSAVASSLATQPRATTQREMERLALSEGFSAAEVLAARKEDLDLLSTKKLLEAIEGVTPPNWRVLDAARFAKKHKQETDAEQYIFTDEARTLMSWELSKIARHAMALGIDSDYIADVMRRSSEYGSIEEPDALPEDDKRAREQAKLRRQKYLDSATVAEQTRFHETKGDGTVDVQSAEWELVGPIISQSKGIHHHLRFLPIHHLVSRAEEVGVPKKQRKAARKERSDLCKAILAHRFANPEPVEFWTGGLGVKKRDPFAVQEGKLPKDVDSFRKSHNLQGPETFDKMMHKTFRGKPASP